MGCGQSAAHPASTEAVGSRYRTTAVDEARSILRKAAHKCKIAAFARLDENPLLSDKEREQLRQVLNRRSLDKIYKTKSKVGALTDVADVQDPTHFLVYDAITSEDTENAISSTDPGLTFDDSTTEECRLRSPHLHREDNESVTILYVPRVIVPAAAGEFSNPNDDLLRNQPPSHATKPPRSNLSVKSEEAPPPSDPLMMLLSPGMILSSDAMDEDALSESSLFRKGVQPRSFISPLPRDALQPRCGSPLSLVSCEDAGSRLSNHDASLTAQGALQKWSRTTANTQSSACSGTPAPSCSVSSVTRSVTFLDDVTVVYVDE